VGSPPPADPERIVIDYEGNLYGAANIVTFADRVCVAAERHTARDPTIARQYVHAGDLIAVGLWDSDEGVVQVTDPEPLAAWLGGVIASRELLATAFRYQHRRQWRALLASANSAIRLFAQQYLRRPKP